MHQSVLVMETARWKLNMWNALRRCKHNCVVVRTDYSFASHDHCSRSSRREPCWSEHKFWSFILEKNPELCTRKVLMRMFDCPIDIQSFTICSRAQPCLNNVRHTWLAYYPVLCLHLFHQVEHQQRMRRWYQGKREKNSIRRQNVRHQVNAFFTASWPLT